MNKSNHRHSHVFLCAFITLLFCTFLMPQNTAQVHAKPSKKTITAAKKAYRVYLIKKIATDSNIQFSLTDLNNDGLPELILLSSDTSGNYQTIYGYVGKKVKKILTGGVNGYFSYKKSNNTVVFIKADSSSTQRIVYKWNGKKLSLVKSFLHKIENYTSTYTINGKTTKASDYYPEYEKYSGGQTLSFDYATINSVNGALSSQLTNKKYTLMAGDSGSIYLQTTASKVTWKSSNSSVVKINPGSAYSDQTECSFTGKKAGTATLTATANGKKYKCKVTVKQLNTNVIQLYEGREYTYDLNNDGIAEVISWKSAVSSDDDYTISIMINNEVVLTRTEHGYSASVQLTDILSSDSYKEIRVYITADNDGTTCDTYYRYTDSALTAYANFTPSSARAYLHQISGNGTVIYREDTPVNHNALKCYYALSTYKVENQTFVRQNETTYTIAPHWTNSPYTACKKLSVKKKPGGAKTAFTLNVGDTFQLKELRKDGKKIYIKLTSSSGKNGWLKAPAKTFFAESYYWG